MAPTFANTAEQRWRFRTMADYAGDLRRLCDKCVHNFGVCPPCDDCDGQESFEAEGQDDE